MHILFICLYFNFEHKTLAHICVQVDRFIVSGQIEVMHDYQGIRSCLYGSHPETDSETEDNPEQVTRWAVYLSQ